MLGEWDSLALTVLHETGNDLDVLWEDDYTDPYLGLFLRAFSKLKNGLNDEDGIFTPWSPEYPNPVFALVEEGLSSVDKRATLENHFSSELATVALLQGDYNLSRHYSKFSQNLILERFSRLHPLAVESRLKLLRRLQTLVELNEFLEVSPNLKSTPQKMEIDRLLRSWENRFPDQSTDGVDIWEDVVSNRDIMLERIREGLTAKSSALGRSELPIRLDTLRRTDQQQIAEASMRQKNFTLAEKWLTVNKGEDNAFDPLFHLLAFRLSICKMETSKDSAVLADIFSRFVGTFSWYKADVDALDPPTLSRFLNIQGQAYATGLNILVNSKGGDAFAELLTKSKPLRKSASLNGHDAPGNAQDIMKILVSTSFECLRQAQEISEESAGEDSNDLVFAAHCDKVLQMVENDANPELRPAIDQVEYAKIITSSVLGAMRSGVTNSIEKFPRLLQLIADYPALRVVFSEQAEGIPTWMFLRWLPQMTALLDKSSGSVLIPTLRKIANDYPQALYAPLSISSEQYLFLNDQTSRKAAKDVEQLKSKVALPELKLVVRELKRLTDPLHVLKDWYEQTEAMLNGGVADKATKILEAFQEICEYCLVPNKDMGSDAAQFAKKYGAQILQSCGKDGSKLSKMSAKDFKAAVGPHYAKVKEAESGPKAVSGKTDKQALKLYSPWLASFQGHRFEELVEIPGQYVGTSKPNPQAHAKITGFRPQVLVMRSIRRPKRVVIVGSDEKEYPWLVKGGEDLRLDQRVEQLFDVMNSAMATNGYLSQNKITLKTYKVVPMSTSLGILEWVNNTKPLRVCMSDVKGYAEDYGLAQGGYDDFVRRGSKGKKSLGDAPRCALADKWNLEITVLVYGQLFAYSREEVANQMSRYYAQMTKSYLRIFLQELATSPEAFLTIRKEFARSFGALNIASYILGIGDRHLENFLVDLKSGRVIAIDFGHAFGSATEVLPVPELVPFRLTRQIVQTMEPLGVEGLMQYPMVQVMKALQENQDALLNVMDIFVKEPLIEWRKFALALAQKQVKSNNSLLESMESEQSTITAPQWYPQQKLAIARRKLEGENPAYITAQELEWGHRDKKWFSNAKTVLMGDARVNRRAQAGRVCKDVKEQVECLIDQATDPSILGRAWRGWSSWS
ncbi:hypothetical protein HK097_007924 [Rhizophlyctis rosea]|uniref:Non-specific serine/threonine protein kinase n=1 Tax=Rhizophlyctis rosea TaxID=64517 RepID=A0AAD5SB05_9FUNG|nr:hypothetical protein HK097_007924 [Rhizophlyctis rosea]